MITAAPELEVVLMVTDLVFPLPDTLAVATELSELEAETTNGAVPKERVTDTARFSLKYMA